MDEKFEIKMPKTPFCKSSLLMGPYYDVMIYKMRMGDPIEINLVQLDFSFKELSNKNKKLIGQK